MPKSPLVTINVTPVTDIEVRAAEDNVNDMPPNF